MGERGGWGEGGQGAHLKIDVTDGTLRADIVDDSDVWGRGDRGLASTVAGSLNLQPHTETYEKYNAQSSLLWKSSPAVAELRTHHARLVCAPA